MRVDHAPAGLANAQRDADLFFVFILFILFFRHIYFTTQHVGGFTLSDLCRGPATGDRGRNQREGEDRGRQQPLLLLLKNDPILIASSFFFLF